MKRAFLLKTQLVTMYRETRIKKINLILQGTLFIMLIACSEKPATTVAKDEPVKVTTSVVKTAKSKQLLSYSGTIIPFQTIPVTFETPGTVKSVNVEEGMEVKKGQVLATLDPTDLQNIYKLSETQYNQALDAYNRLKEVHDKGSLVEIKWVEIESKLNQAESTMKLSKNNLNKTTLNAPENGIIGKRNIEPGMSSIGLSAPFEIVKIDRIYVRISVPENEIAKIKQGMTAKFNVPAIGDTTFTGTATIIGVVADRFSRTYEVKIVAENPERIIKPGMICDLTIECPQEDINIIDYRAITTDMEGAFVYKISPSRDAVIKQHVKTGKTSEEGIEIISGLMAGDEVVCEGLYKLTDNSKIEL